MSLEIKNTKNLILPDKFRMVALIYGLPGSGKTQWVGTAPNPGIAACETGEGNGLLTIAGMGHDYITPANYMEFEAFCNGNLFKDKSSIVLDSLSDVNQTFIKDYALSIPRTRGESPKRRLGIPELDDYGTMGEITRRTIRKLIDSYPDKHIFVTAKEKYDKADPENGQAETLVGPELPGAMMLGSTAMFDFVFRIRTRQILRDPKDPKSRFVQRYIQTAADGQGTVAKCRGNQPDGKGHPLLDPIETINLETGEGTIPWLLEKVRAGFTGQEK